MSPIQNALLRYLPEGIDLAKIQTVCIPLCLGDPRDQKDGCHARFNDAIKAQNPETTLVIQTGGSKELPLCDLMKEYLQLKNHTWARRFVSVCLGWGTRSEIRNAFNIIQQLNHCSLKSKGINTDANEFRVVISSNRLHLWRIKWFVRLYNVDNLNVEYRKSSHPFSLYSSIRELGTIGVVLTDFFVRGIKNLRKENMVEFYNAAV